MIEDTELTFGQLLKTMIKQSGFSNYEFYTQLGIAKPYFYEIIGDRTNPPPPEKQFAILKLLNVDKKTEENFFNLAAEARDEVPADIAKYLKENNLYSAIRADIKRS
ncbi:MAG: hypothetical protein IJJ61_09595 [Clostridia bacterium]|nr:hypothetical protein [Clostridia bacterium]